jgi:hypothetical protein
MYVESCFIYLYQNKKRLHAKIINQPTYTHIRSFEMQKPELYRHFVEKKTQKIRKVSYFNLERVTNMTTKETIGLGRLARCRPDAAPTCFPNCNVVLHQNGAALP